MMSQTPKEYLEGFKCYLKLEFEKVHNLKLQSISERQHEMAEAFREIEKKILSFINLIDSTKATA